MDQTINECSSFLREKLDFIPQTAIVLGSGLGAFADCLEDRTQIDYSMLEGWPVSTAPGHAGKLIAGRIGGKTILVMQGRVHYYEGYSMQDIIFPVRVLGKLGIADLVLTNASGGINYCYDPGDLVLVDDHINLMGCNPLRGENDDESGPRFPDMTYAYSGDLKRRMEKAALKESIHLQRGVYVAFPGPSYETPAEIRMARTMGADLVGMSTVPEVIAANHMGINVCAVSCVANYAAGMTSDRLTEEEVLAEMNKASSRLVRLIKAFMLG